MSVQAVRIPEVFVLWHPRCRLGETLARRILAWLRPRNGLGPEVFYRSLPAPGAVANGLPPPLTREAKRPSRTPTKTREEVTNLQIIVPLIDENMVADATWRYWLEQLATSSSSAAQSSIMPVALDATAYNVTPALRDLNYLRPAGLPLPAGEDVRGLSTEIVVRSLLKQITEAMCRLILPRSEPNQSGSRRSAANEPLPKVNIFLSHAKVDGTVPARRLRDYIYGQTQLAAFYDENDIAFGSAFARVIGDGLSSQDTAALIAIRSAQYANRPWCRRELSVFRRPRKDMVPPGQAERWSLYPTLMVEVMEGGQFSFGVPEFGNSSVIRWTDDDRNLEELIVTTVIRDAMLAAFHSAMAASIPSSSTQIVIGWLPDPTTLLHIPSIRAGEERDVLYPGRGLSGLELDILSDYFPKLTFRSFEEVLL
jgi:hypothetical protein